MKPFENITADGNEKAVKRGKVVPSDAVNIAWSKSPAMTTDKNVVMVDTSQTVEQNSIKDTVARKIYYANSVGVLEDAFGNQLVEDEFPIVSDVFAPDEDFSTIPADTYQDTDILPFVHVSRYFHADYAGLTLHHDLLTYKNAKIKVIDDKGREHLDANGNPRYKVKIFTAFSADTSNQNAYRLHVFVDDDTNESLKLTYNKVELDADGHTFGSDPGHKELLNPQPYYDYRPEESEVVDPANRDERIYSTRPMALKEQILGYPAGGQDGYKVYVPKKAIGDPRIFQVFRWRVSCNFIQQYRVEQESPRGIKCGVIVTDGQHSPTPYPFLNLSRSQYNVTKMKFYNPLQADDDVTSQENCSYWEVDFDTVSYSDLRQFDILIWSPQHNIITNVGKYAGKIDFFTRQVGGTLLIDTNTRAWIQGFGVRMGPPVSIALGFPIMSNGDPTNLRAYGYPRIRQADIHHELFEGALAYGGWSFNADPRLDNTTWNDVGWHSQVTDEYETLSIYSSLFANIQGGPTVHFFKEIPTGWEPILNIQTPLDLVWHGVYKPALISRTLRTVPAAVKMNWKDGWVNQFQPNYQYAGDPAGHIVMTTLGIADSVNCLADNVTQTLVDFNRGETLAPYDNYRLYINSSWTEGAYKFLLNLCLVALKNKPLSDPDERAFSTTFSVSSPWKSSWVTDGDVLSDSEKNANDFSLMPIDAATASPVWQRQLSNSTLKQIIDDSLTPDMQQKVQGAVRQYVINVTSSTVQVPSEVGDSSLPFAWTNEYSPEFEVPIELGPYVIRDEQIKAQYEAGQFIHKSYPAKPYNAHVRLSSVQSTELQPIAPITWTVHGVASETLTTDTLIPPSTSTKESEVELNWADDGASGFVSSGYPWEKGMSVPQGIDTWNNYNYYDSSWGRGQLNWPSYGMYFQLDLGSRGDVVMWVQDAMNVFQFYGLFHYGELALDGEYGPKTRACILAFQAAFGCTLIDGIVDAETFYIIGSQVIRLGDLIYKNRSSSGWSRYYFWPRTRMLRQAISDGNLGTAFAKRTWLTNGPSVAWDMFMVVFNSVYDIHGVTFTPFVEGDTPTVMFRSIDIRTQPFGLKNYDARTGNPIYLPYRPRDGQSIYVPFAPRRGDTLIVGVGQDGPSGWGGSRVFGVRDLTAHARVKTTVTKKGSGSIKKQTVDTDVTYSGVSYVTGDSKVRIPFPAPSSPNAKVNSVQWDSVTSDNPAVVTKLVSGAYFGTYLYLSNYAKEVLEETNNSYGPRFPDSYLGDTPYYWKNADTGKVSGMRETGWISKTDGVKVLCAKDGSPIGFPDSIPSMVAATDEAQVHFSTMTIESIGNDASVQVGFYDINHKEFVTNVQGQPEMTFIEYLERGRSNVFVAVVSTYEVETSEPLPTDDDAPMIPYKWAMPVYGLYKRTGSKIGIGSLPKDLGMDDLWPIPIKTGKFDRQIFIRPNSSGTLGGWIGKYQNSTVTAHYAIPESQDSAWSQIWGPPYHDIVGEQPDILGDSALMVHQSPILMRKVPSPNQSLADPVRPVFTVYNRATEDGDWIALKPSDISDYNVSTGEIYLKTPMQSSDPALWGVDYTTDRQDFQFKGAYDNIVDVNPYSIYSKPYLMSPTYVYMIPQKVLDASGRIIPESLVSNTIYITRDPSMFDPLNPLYNPIAVELGVIYLSTVLDINDLTMFDSRKRGGGVRAEATVEEIKRIAQEAANFWDMDVDGAPSYQKAGFVVIRLPVELKSSFTEQEITAIISKNITAGVKFKIEDLSGKDWS